MSDGSEQGAQQAKQPVPEAAPAAQDQEDQENQEDQEQATLNSVTSLERLRERVGAAVRHLERLRAENEALHRRIKELEKNPAVEVDGTLLSFEEDPEVLRRKVEGFIQAIDVYLAKENQ